jgi:uncharacterized protein involved in exopolysaccharide biosynthesis
MTAADDLRDLAVTVARIESKLDRVLEDAADHEDRVRALERWRWIVVGAALGTGAAAGGISSALLH